MTREQRVWVLPAMFALVILSLPVQMLFAARFSEPYPGLFQPFFYGDSQSGGVIDVKAVEMEVDGRRIEPFDLFPADGPAREIVSSMFPPGDGEMRVDEGTRTSIRATLASKLGTEPRELSITWERRRFDLATGKVSERSTLARYHLDFTGRAR
jgi:hypothetical protein